MSVIVPVYNGENYISEALQSIFDQSVKPGEIIVVNDGSDDDTELIVRGIPGVRLIDQSKSGGAVALNRGISESVGDILCFLDHDDLWKPDKIEKQLLSMQDNNAEMIFSLIENFISPELSREDQNKLDINLKAQVGIHKSTMMIKKDSFHKVGSFNQANRVELLEWYAQAKDLQLKEFTVPEVLVKRRIHGCNTTLKNKELRMEYPSIIKAILDRRRNENGGQ